VLIALISFKDYITICLNHHPNEYFLCEGEIPYWSMLAGLELNNGIITDKRL
jgi:hypothetical protein